MVVTLTSVWTCVLTPFGIFKRAIRMARITNTYIVEKDRVGAVLLPDLVMLVTTTNAKRSWNGHTHTCLSVLSGACSILDTLVSVSQCDVIMPIVCLNQRQWEKNDFCTRTTTTTTLRFLVAHSVFWLNDVDKWKNELFPFDHTTV